jgi:uncharacterized protein (DUF3820 family)
MNVNRDILRFEGHVDDRQVDRLLVDLHAELQQMNLALLTRKRIYAVSVECLDNISQHADVGQIDGRWLRDYPSSYILEFAQKGFRIKVANLLRNEKIAYIKRQLTMLNEMGKQQVHELFKENIRQGARQHEGGGQGLGLMVLARAADGPVDFHFEPVFSDYAYFTMIIFIQR